MRPVLLLVVMLLFASACSGASGIAPAASTIPSARAAAADPPTPGEAAVGDITIAPNPVAVPRTVVTTAAPTTNDATATTTAAPSNPPDSDPTSTITTSTEPTVPTTFDPLATSPAPGSQQDPTGARTGIGTDPPPGSLALTFDDGPLAGRTEEILALLGDYGVTATFFISTHLLPGNEYLIPKIVAAGHSVQSRGDQDVDFTTLTPDQMRADLQTSIDKIVAAGAPRPVCFRPPVGLTDLVVESVASDLGLTVLTWNLDSLDATLQEPAGIIDRVLSQAGAGSVILMHDLWAPVHRTTLRAIIPELRGRGLEFSPLCTAAG